MKVKTLIEKTNEYRKFEDMIINLEEAVKNLKGKPKDNNNNNDIFYKYMDGNFTTMGGIVTRTILTNTVQTVYTNACLSTEVTSFLRSDLIVFLEEKITHLKKLQDNLEI